MPLLPELLDANARFALNHRGTTNHLPMALVALAGMGAGDARLQSYFDWWAETIALPRPDDAPVAGRENWRGFLGGGAVAFGPLSDAFRTWIEVQGPAAVIGEVAPAVTRAPGTGAFHAVIRLAYGLEAGHAGEIAAGLAAWVVGRKDLGLSGLVAAAPRAASAKAGLDGIADAVGGRSPMGGSITGAMAKVAAEPAFRDALTGPPAEGAALLPILAEAAIRLYWQVPNFTILHLVTGVHAARVIAERLPDLAGDAFAQALWADWCAAYATVGAPRFADRPVEGAADDWPAIFAAAVASDDDHVIKLSWSCHAEGARYGDAAYRTVATRLTKLG